MEDILKYMIDRQWADDDKSDRKLYLFKMAQESKKITHISNKIGGMLIYNQLIEEFLKDITELSIYYIKAEIWPADVKLDVNLSEMTFGRLINSFEQYATIEYNRDVLLEELKIYKKKRNQVVHNLFDILDFDKLALELDEYAELAEEIVFLLLEYDNSVCQKFCDLDERIDFSEFIEIKE